MFFKLLFILFVDGLLKTELIVFLEDLRGGFLKNLNQFLQRSGSLVSQCPLKRLMIANDAVVVSADVKILDDIVVNFSDVNVFSFVEKER